MKVVIKDNNGNVVIEREISKEEVLLEVSVKEGAYSMGQKDDPRKLIGAYH